MLTGVQVRNALGTLVQTFGMTELTTSTKYVITDIQGQGPVKAEINTSPFGSSDGESLQSTRTPKRNLVITLGYNPNYATDETVEDLRLALYRMMPPEAQVQLRMLNNNMETVSIEGVVEGLEPVIWSSEPSVAISIICPLPYFQSLVTTKITLDSNEAVTFNYPGSAVTGFTFVTDATSNINSVQLTNGIDSIYWHGSLPNDARLTFSTIPRNRYIRKSDGQNVLEGIAGGSLRMGIGPLNTYYKFIARNGDDLRTANGTLTFKAQYVGV